MMITVNGERHELPAGATVASIVELLSDAADGRGIAVAVGGEVVPRAAWLRTILEDGANVEVVAAVQGG
jgi:sulfur carrier protein